MSDKLDKIRERIKEREKVKKREEEVRREAEKEKEKAKERVKTYYTNRFNHSNLTIKEDSNVYYKNSDGEYSILLSLRKNAISTFSKIPKMFLIKKANNIYLKLFKEPLTFFKDSEYLDLIGVKHNLIISKKDNTTLSLPQYNLYVVLDKNDVAILDPSQCYQSLNAGDFIIFSTGKSNIVRNDEGKIIITLKKN